MRRASFAGATSPTTTASDRSPTRSSLRSIAWVARRTPSDRACLVAAMPPGDRAPIAWRLLLALAAVKVAVHALSGWLLAWGYMTDELYFLDCADRLDWGYVDHPPLSIAVLAAVRALLG